MISIDFYDYWDDICYDCEFVNDIEVVIWLGLMLLFFGIGFYWVKRVMCDVGFVLGIDWFDVSVSFIEIIVIVYCGDNFCIVVCEVYWVCVDFLCIVVFEDFVYNLLVGMIGCELELWLDYILCMVCFKWVEW